MTSNDIPIITLAGRYLRCDQDRFIVKGVVYQIYAGDPHASDPLRDSRIEDLKRDTVLFKDLGLNAIWVYQIDPSQPHDLCMNHLASSGIYVIACLNDGTHRNIIRRTDPRESYTPAVRSQFRSITDLMSKYDNTLAVSVSNSLINGYCLRDGQIDSAVETVGFAIRDLKIHMRAQYQDKQQRVLPVCMADTSWSFLNARTFETLAASGADHGLDVYCINHYVGMDLGDFKQMPWNKVHTVPKLQHSDHQHNIIPILLSEYSGPCEDSIRSFQETQDLYANAASFTKNTEGRNEAGDPADGDMLDIISGGFMYEFFEGSNRYGLVKVDRNSGTLTKLPDYFAFREKLHASASTTDIVVTNTSTS